MEIPCWRGHLFLPAQQPGLASGNSLWNFPQGVTPSPSPGCRVQVPADHPQRGRVAQASAFRGKEAGLRAAHALTGVNKCLTPALAWMMGTEMASFCQVWWAGGHHMPTGRWPPEDMASLGAREQKGNSRGDRWGGKKREQAGQTVPALGPAVCEAAGSRCEGQKMFLLCFS